MAAFIDRDSRGLYSTNDLPCKITTTVWHPHSERPEYVPGGDNRLITCMNMERMLFGAMKGLNVGYSRLNPDGSINSCADTWHSEKWKRKAAIKWEHLCPDTWWTYVRDLTPEGI